MSTPRFALRPSPTFGMAFLWTRWNEGWMFDLILPGFTLSYCTVPTK